MTRRDISAAAPIAFCCVALSGCSQKIIADATAQQPQIVEVRHQDANLLLVTHSDRFPLAIAAAVTVAPDLNVTGTVTPDVSRNVPVISMASGRILEIRARLGDSVTKGQLLMRVQSSDLASAFADYRQALADENLAVAQLKRAKVLYDKGAIAQKDLEVLQEAEEKADITAETAADRLKVLGVDKDHPTSIAEITAPASGVITDEQVTAGSGTQGLPSPNAFTISDLSRLWILCDVYENDLPLVRVGDPSEIHLDAYPRVVLKGRINNIGPILDPNIRTAKVRIEIDNPGLLRLGMFVRATFRTRQQEVRAVVPATAILHLHDRDWVFIPQDLRTFRRVEVQAGKMVHSNQQEIVSGLRPGSRVVADALLLESTSDQ